MRSTNICPRRADNAHGVCARWRSRSQAALVREGPQPARRQRLRKCLSAQFAASDQAPGRAILAKQAETETRRQQVVELIDLNDGGHSREM